MKKLITGILLLAVCFTFAQTGSYIIVPKKFSIGTKAWIVQQYKKALPQGEPVLYRENLVAACGNNYPCQSTLPVTGLELTGVRMNNEAVKLNWKTYTEINNKGFDVERKYGTDGPFAIVAFVPGSFNSQTTKFYQLMDNNNYQATSYYRIKQTDIDGRVSYSNTVAVKGYVNEIGIAAYPNPATADNINFAVTGLKQGTTVNLVIYDIAGKIIYEQQHYRLTNTYTISYKNSFSMAPGIYYVSLMADNKKANAAFVITK
jgi:Secretion system C-terminal sorting domain